MKKITKEAHESVALDRERAKSLHEQKLNRELSKENRRLQDEMETLLELRRRKIDTFSIKPNPSLSSEATAFAIASDWHVEETVKRSQTNGLNEYNLDIAKKRATQFFVNTLKMVKKERGALPIHNLVVGLLGDFITGELRYDSAESNSLDPIEAIQYATTLLASGIRFLLKESDLKLTFVCCSGNHGRITPKVNIGHETGNSLDAFMYFNLEQMFQNEKRIRFIREDGYLTYLRVYSYDIRFHHGHAVRYIDGVGGLTIPMNKAIAKWDSTKPAYVSCCGHHHTYTPSRKFIVNGSLIGYNPYALFVKAGYEPPMQAFFLIDKKRGLTVQMPLLVDE